MQDYCLNKDDHQFILDVTQFKSRSPALEDPYKNVPTSTKSAFTRHATIGSEANQLTLIAFHIQKEKFHCLCSDLWASSLLLLGTCR